MNKALDQAFSFDDYSKKMALEKARRSTLAKDIFLVAMLFLVASGAAFYYDAHVTSVGLFFVFLIVQQVASEARLEISMIDTNAWLAQLLNQHSRELEQLRSELRNEQYVRTR